MDILDSVKIPLRDNSNRGKINLIVFYILAVYTAIHFILGRFSDHTALLNGEIVEMQQPELWKVWAWTFFNVILNYTLVIVNCICFLMWMARAYANLKRTGQETESSVAMSVWSYFIPIVNLFYPYQIMKEI
ncbi:hypothetical protein FUAX_06790 [Fulvitalea axinellae]|uniref:DUF4328 domain-containing protein n=1 Tax=Fulvitalea axinellae TaxID=1182444 RepID=A0AAU9CK25_9BACT|nr:hypothetical protein FUAX_06790 [Fulvitalea axinellae]